MVSPILSRKRWKLYAHDQHIVVVNGQRERFVHPLMKAFIWALYLPQYPTASIEIRIGDKYKPDVVAFDADAGIYQRKMPSFWGEAGRVGRDKINSLVRRFPDTHFVIGKWATRLNPHVELVRTALADTTRNAPFDLISFPNETRQCVDADGNITISFDDVEWVRLDE
jgi:hypothetical protein